MPVLRFSIIKSGIESISERNNTVRVENTFISPVLRAFNKFFMSEGAESKGGIQNVWKIS